MRLNSYLNFLEESIFNVLNKNKDTSLLTKKAEALLKNNNEGVYSPDLISYLINKHIRELEYSFVVKGLAHRCLSIDKYTDRYINKMRFFEAIEKSYTEGTINIYQELISSKNFN